ncbi:MAG: hypothetical protein WAL41_25095 [Mycobacterium sp.]
MQFKNSVTKSLATKSPVTRRLVTNWASVATCLFLVSAFAAAGDLRISVPRSVPSTPVQNLNRDGVRELKKGKETKAKQLFYKAYLLDPNDPFTLNNLGYISELDGNADRALRFYALASRSQTEAVIDEASRPGLKGLPVSDAFGRVGDYKTQANRVNEQSIVLLEKGRLSETKALLKAALSRTPHDPFLLNNLGYVAEGEGDLESALNFYSAAASMHSHEPVVLALRSKSRGKPISEVAAENAKEVSAAIAKGEDTPARVARLNLRGVASLNDNNIHAARAFFMQAYRLNAQNAFTLNNLGYIYELAGDRESAQMYYQAARAGADASIRVTYSTRMDAEGRKLDELAEDNQGGVDSVLKGIQEAKRRSGQPVHLIVRGAAGSAEDEPGKSAPLELKNPALPPLRVPDSTTPETPVQPPATSPTQAPPSAQ